MENIVSSVGYRSLILEDDGTAEAPNGLELDPVAVEDGGLVASDTQHHVTFLKNENKSAHVCGVGGES